MKESVSSKEPFNQLFSPGRIGKMILRNRLVMPPMETNYGKGQGFVRDQHRAYYEPRAKGGVGLIIVEAICVDRLGSLLPGNLIMDDDAYIPAMAELVRSIQKHGVRAAAQLCHGGVLSSREIIGVQPAGPSASKNFKGDISREMTLQEISDQIHLFANAAARAKRAGFDAVEIHGATSYLIAQFLSGYWNRRKDQYGGPLENRARFLIQVIQASKAAVGEDFPVWCRINGGEFGLEGGTTLEEAKQVAKWAETAGSDAIHVSSFGGGSQSYMGPPVVDHNVLLPLAQEIKKGLRIPVIAVGRITPDQGEKALAEGKADFIAIGRGVIADPDLPNKLAQGRSEDIRPCIGCQECISRIMFKMEPLRCTVNALCGWEEEYPIEPAPTPKKIIIIGGGPGGLEAARVAALRGHLARLRGFNSLDKLFNLF